MFSNLVVIWFYISVTTYLLSLSDFSKFLILPVSVVPLTPFIVTDIVKMKRGVYLGFCQVFNIHEDEVKFAYTNQRRTEWYDIQRRKNAEWKIKGIEIVLKTGSHILRIDEERVKYDMHRVHVFTISNGLYIAVGRLNQADCNFKISMCRKKLK